ncbi:MAG: D-2-hydroxyacid dehydrogenase [Dehalococcoidia bacterium]
MKLVVSSQVAATYAAGLERVAPNLDLVTIDADHVWHGDPVNAAAAYLSFDMYPSRVVSTVLTGIDRMPNLRWIHTYSIGVDHPMYRPIVERGITFTNGAGSQSIPIAQHILLMMLHHAKRMDIWEQAQGERAWRHAPSDELTDKTVALFGLGGIGTEVARLAKAFRMRVLGLRRRPESVANVDELFSPGEVGRLCAEADYLVICAPLTRATRGAIGASELAMMKPSAYLINVARGPIVDEPALVAALREGRIAGAALDVFEVEPLPPDHALWTLPNVVITPHTAPASPWHIRRGTELFLENLRRFSTGQDLLNVVDAEDVGVSEAARRWDDT